MVGLDLLEELQLVLPVEMVEVPDPGRLPFVELHGFQEVQYVSSKILGVDLHEPLDELVGVRLILEPGPGIIESLSQIWIHFFTCRSIRDDGPCLHNYCRVGLCFGGLGSRLA